MNKLLLIDTFNFLHRAYHALPLTLTDVNGEPTNAVYGVAAMLVSVIDQIKPTHLVAALDGKKPTFRVEEFTGYKAHRAEMEPALENQIPKVLDLLDAFGVKKIVIEGYEADDIIGTMAKNFANSKTQVIVVSNDRDLWQLINKNVVAMLPNTKGPPEWIGEEEVKKRMGFEPKMMIDYKGLRGDPSDNIPGVYGIGEKTALKLITEFGSVEDIYKNAEKITPPSLREKLLNSYEIALTSKKLATIITDVPVTVTLNECKYAGYDLKGAYELLKKYRFKSLIKRMGLDARFSNPTEDLQSDSAQPDLFS